MPTLNWIGKQAVVEHHDDVPFRLLREAPGMAVGDSAAKQQPSNKQRAENMLIQGDNLEALKALLPYYAGEVKCIYIDPPYNTGNEGWAYNDNVNSPAMRAWLNRTVGKEAEDLSRHDKWLCMMYPRLVLLRELLAEDGSFWMSIDDNEVHHARALLDEVFGGNNFVATVVWQKRTSPDTRLNLGPAHDYIVVYTKSEKNLDLNRISLSGERAKAYTNPDDDPRGPWASVDLTGQTGHATPEQFYEIQTPGGAVYSPPPGRCWALAERTFKSLVADNRVWFGEDGNNRPRKKKFLSEAEGMTSWTWWPNDEVGHNQEAKKEVNEVIGESDLFDTPKPTRLIKRILEIATDPEGGDLVLDSFAGSGTTGHAVLKQNAQDGGDRRFILVEMEESVARPVTHLRLQRVVDGYDYTGTDRTELFNPSLGIRELKKADKLLAETDRLKKEHADEYDGFERRLEDGRLILRGKKKIKGRKDGLGGGFRFFELGPEVFGADGRIREDVAFDELARHVFFAHTGRPLPRESPLDSPLIGASAGTALYLLFNGVLKDISEDGGNVLTRSLLQNLPKHDGPKAVYGAACLLSKAQLREQAVTFHQIPYQVRVS